MSDAQSPSPVELERALHSLYELRSTARRLVRKTNWLINQVQLSRSQTDLSLMASPASVPQSEQLQSAITTLEAALALTRP